MRYEHPHPMLHERDMRRWRSFNMILKLCSDREMKPSEISYVTDKKLQGIRNHLDELVKEGYMEIITKITKHTDKIIKYYKTIIPEYHLNNMIPSSIKVKMACIKNGTRAGAPGELDIYLIPKVQPPALPSHIHTYKERHPPRQTRKTVHTGISSSLGMTW